jgi:hypothetical protein
LWWPRSTGLTSPIIRTEETRSPDQVARLAGLMLFQDFGPVITIVGGSETDPTGLVAHARGAALAPLEKFIKPGDIFAVSLISRSMAVPERSSRGKPSTSAPARTIATVGTPREFTLLKAITSPKADGKFRVSVITRFETGLPATMSGLLGVRGLKLPAQSGPVAVRVLTEDGKPHPRASLINVMGTDGDYAVNPRPRDGFAYDPAAGVFRSPRPLSNVACLIVGLSPTYSQRFPVPVLGPEPIVVKFPIDEATARRAELEKASLALRLRIGEAHSALTTLFKAIGDLVSQQRNRDALDRLTDGIAAAVVADQSLTAELERVKKFPGANAGTAAGTLTDCEQQLKTFREYRDHLKQYEERLAAAAKLDPVRMEKELRAKDLASRIASLREQGEIPEALETYDELYELTKDDKFRVEKEKLARQWAPVDEEHRAAREVILIKWPVAQTLEDFIATTGPLNKAIDVLIKKKDVMGVRKALNSFNPAYAKIKGLVDPLDPTNAMDVEKLGQLNSISQELQLLANRAQDWLKKELAKK